MQRLAVKTNPLSTWLSSSIDAYVFRILCGDFCVIPKFLLMSARRSRIQPVDSLLPSARVKMKSSPVFPDNSFGIIQLYSSGTTTVLSPALVFGKSFTLKTEYPVYLRRVSVRLIAIVRPLKSLRFSVTNSPTRMPVKNISKIPKLCKSKFSIKYRTIFSNSSSL